jgi:SAM-dependent methyltransferase
MPTNVIFDVNMHYKTVNKRGFMHPLSEIGRKFTLFSSTTVAPVMDMGCAYGNIAIAALEAGAKTVIACDMEEKHLSSLRDQVKNTNLKDCLLTKQGVFPDGFDFKTNSFDAIHASHILEYLNGEEVERGLENFYQWLQPGGKLFILTYTIYILELNNDKFKAEYERRLEDKVKWPGYLENFDDYCVLPDETDVTSQNTNEATKTDIDSPFPSALHMYDLPVLRKALETYGFVIEFAEYLDGSNNGAVKETWHDGREYVGFVARKP